MLSAHSALADIVLDKIMLLPPDFINVGVYTIKVINTDFVAEVWNTNKYYAWMSEGFIKNKITGSSISYSDCRPSRKKMIEFNNWINEQTAKLLFEVK